MREKTGSVYPDLALSRSKSLRGKSYIRLFLTLANRKLISYTASQIGLINDCLCSSVANFPHRSTLSLTPCSSPPSCFQSLNRDGSEPKKRLAVCREDAHDYVECALQDASRLRPVLGGRLLVNEESYCIKQLVILFQLNR